MSRSEKPKKKNKNKPKPYAGTTQRQPGCASGCSSDERSSRQPPAPRSGRHTPQETKACLFRWCFCSCLQISIFPRIRDCEIRNLIFTANGARECGRRCTTIHCPVPPFHRITRCRLAARLGSCRWSGARRQGRRGACPWARRRTRALAAWRRAEVRRRRGRGDRQSEAAVGARWEQCSSSSCSSAIENGARGERWCCMSGP